jgi:hypothetical protein
VTFIAEGNMNKRRWRIALFVGVGLLILVALVMAWDLVVIAYYVNMERARVVPTKRIRPAFRFVVGGDLPEKTEGLGAIFWGGRDPAIFVKFRTNPEGIAYVLETFGGSGVESEPFDADDLRVLRASGWEMFGGLSRVQERLGAQLFDQDSIGPGRRLLKGDGRRNSELQYLIFIDEQKRTVYIKAWLT